jgi:murein DD-endopeptidase MepM/ murein hydrolase activator NlpD
MRRWERHLARSKVVLFLLINLVALLGGKYLVLITIFKAEVFGDAVAFAKAPKKKALKTHLSRSRHVAPPSPAVDHRHRRFLPHRVRPGETLWQIAEVYGTRVSTLRVINRLEDLEYLQAGDVLLIPNERIFSIFQPEPSFNPGDRALFLSAPRYLDRRAHSQARGRDSFFWPVEGLLTSLYGTREDAMGGGFTQFHAGIDISVPSGTPVRAAQEGLVVFAGYSGAYGKVIKLDHLNGFSTLYAHNSRILVHVGQMVKGGQVISLSGSTGRSTGPHLHFEVQREGWPEDPLEYLH